MGDTTELLRRLNRGDQAAFGELVPLVYNELRLRARRQLVHNGNNHTLQATALVHEAFLKLVGKSGSWEDRSHFFNAVAEVMRQLLVNHARSKAAIKRGGRMSRVELRADDIAQPESLTDWTQLDEALEKLRTIDERRYRVVMLRYFAGLTDAEVAKSLGVSEKTAERDWATAKMFLFAELSRPAHPE